VSGETAIRKTDEGRDEVLPRSIDVGDEPPPPVVTRDGRVLGELHPDPEKNATAIRRRSCQAKIAARAPPIEASPVIDTRRLGPKRSRRKNVIFRDSRVADRRGWPVSLLVGDRGQNR